MIRADSEGGEDKRLNFIEWALKSGLKRVVQPASPTKRPVNEFGGQASVRRRKTALREGMVERQVRRGSDAVNSIEPLTSPEAAQDGGPKLKPAETEEEISVLNVELDEYPLDCSKPA